MPKGKLGIGDDAPPDEPEAGAKRASITDKSDGPPADRKKPQAKHADRNDPAEPRKKRTK